jgi:hypothetical protein
MMQGRSVDPIRKGKEKRKHHKMDEVRSAPN